LLKNYEDWLKIWGGVAAALLVPVAVRARRIGIWADADRVVVRNFFFSYELKWADVSRLETVGWQMPSRIPIPTPPWCVFRTRRRLGVVARGLPLFSASDATYDLTKVSRTPVEVVDG